MLVLVNLPGTLYTVMYLMTRRGINSPDSTCSNAIFKRLSANFIKWWNYAKSHTKRKIIPYPSFPCTHFYYRKIQSLHHPPSTYLRSSKVFWGRLQQADSPNRAFLCINWARNILESSHVALCWTSLVSKQYFFFFFRISLLLFAFRYYFHVWEKFSLIWYMFHAPRQSSVAASPVLPCSSQLTNESRARFWGGVCSSGSICCLKCNM